MATGALTPTKSVDGFPSPRWEGESVKRAGRVSVAKGQIRWVSRFPSPQRGGARGGVIMPVKNIVTGQKVTQAKLQRAKELRRQMTPAERRLWQRLRANRLDGFHFRRQQIIAGFIVDFYCHQANLIIEVDGPIHDDRRAADEEREAVLCSGELRVLRFTNAQILQELPSVLDTIREALAGAGI